MMYVLVGDDQKQYLELACDIVVKFNMDMGCDVFVLSELMILFVVVWIMFLCDGIVKMLKLDLSDMSWINLIDDVDMIQ